MAACFPRFVFPNLSNSITNISLIGPACIVCLSWSYHCAQENVVFRPGSLGHCYHHREGPITQRRGWRSSTRGRQHHSSHSPSDSSHAGQPSLWGKGGRVRSIENGHSSLTVGSLLLTGGLSYSFLWLLKGRVPMWSQSPMLFASAGLKCFRRRNYFSIGPRVPTGHTSPLTAVEEEILAI